MKDPFSSLNPLRRRSSSEVESVVVFPTCVILDAEKRMGDFIIN